jgi:adenine-specific DNA-methyltransferase
MPFLDWVNKAQAQRVAADVPYHLLQFESAHGDASTENLLIQGDNLLALKALLPFYRGRVKCIYIDPPYNTQSAFEHYDDKLEHSQWLSMMWPRLVLLRELLAEDGSIWISIDDSEAHYLKVVIDEVFNRKGFVASNVWQKRYSRENREAIGDVHEYIFVYAKHPDVFKKLRNLVPPTEAQAKVYRNPNDDPRGRWRPVPMTAQEGHATPDQFYEIVSPSGKKHRPPQGRCWGIAKATYDRLFADGRIYFGKTGNSQPNTIRYLSEVPGMTPWTWWPSDEVGHTDESKKEIHALFGKTEAFASPKPERLIHRILTIATNPGDLVLDSFLGSGTTAAVAHKMGRPYIGIEMGEHAVTHCLPRLQKVIAGEQGGISKTVGWQGGGGFRFHTLGEPVFNAEGGIHPSVRFAALAAYLWHFETGDPARQVFASPLLGVHEGTAFYLLYNGILGDRRPAGGNVLTANVLANLDALFPHTGPRVIYGETTRLGEARLREAAITFKQIPYDIKAR